MTEAARVGQGGIPKADYNPYADASNSYDAEYLHGLANQGATRTFATGATRDTEEGKLDFEGFLSPLVLNRFAEYMHQKRQMPDGTMRASDNWQKGIPQTVYIKSAWRHFMAVWENHRINAEGREEELCALLFNIMGYLHEELKRGVPSSS
jgi:hypothetical protein